jgi:hypothetical protein
MFIGLFSILAVVSFVLRSFFNTKKREVITEEDLDDFNSGPPLISKMVEKESKVMLPEKFHHNLGSPIYDPKEIQNIIKTYCKKVKTEE